MVDLGNIKFIVVGVLSCWVQQVTRKKNNVGSGIIVLHTTSA